VQNEQPRGLGLVVEAKYKSTIVHWQPGHKIILLLKMLKISKITSQNFKKSKIKIKL
jgi:hypothetical protein